MRGGEGAVVTLVVFSDFQCPFCRQFAAALSEVMAKEPSAVRVAFHHFPLGSHSWARRAAEGAACAQLQDASAFWSMHDALFANQEAITERTINDQLFRFAEATHKLDMAAFRSCMASDMSLGLVFADMNLADEYDVTSTPTVFINGRKVLGMTTYNALRQAVLQAADTERYHSPVSQSRDDSATTAGSSGKR